MTTSKLTYSGVNNRPSTRKNKSLHEVKDLLPKNIYSNPTLLSNQSPTYTFEAQTRGQRDLLSKNKSSYSLFDEVNTASSKSSYARSLFNKIKEEPAPSRYESKIEKGHHRVKSSIVDLYPGKYFSGIERLEEDEKPSCGTTSFGRYQGNNSRGPPLSHDPVHAKGSTDELVNRLIEEHRLARERENRETRENSLQREEAILSGAAAGNPLKEGRRLGDFLSKNGGFLKDKTSTENLRPKMKELSTDNGVDLGIGTYDKRSGAVKLMMSQSPKEGIIEETISPKGGDFIEGYLDYLRCPSRTNRRLSKDEIGVEEKMKSIEEEGREADLRFMKKQIEDVNSKLNEVTKINMKLMKEFSSMLIREQESSQKLGSLEEKFSNLRNKNKKYKKELKYTIQLLEKERIENQTNLLALKKVLANDINTALHNKATRNHNYGSHKDLLIHHHRDRSGNRHIEADTSMRRKEEQQSRKSSEKRQSQKRPENIFTNYASGSPYVMGKSDDSEVADEIEEEDEKLQTTEQDTEEGYNVSPPQYRSPQRSPQKGNKESSKEEQIRILQEKIAEVMVSRNSPVKYNPQQENKVWPKNIEVLSQNYMNQGKSSKHALKHTVSKESTDYHSKAQSTYHSRGEATFE